MNISEKAELAASIGHIGKCTKLFRSKLAATKFFNQF